MKNLSISSLLLSLAITIISCTGYTSKKSESNSNSADFSTPTATIKTFIKASKDRDVETLSKCISTDAPSEFNRIINKKLSERELSEMSKDADEVEVIGEEIHGNRAYVEIKFRKKNSKIILVKEDNSWLIANS